MDEEKAREKVEEGAEDISKEDAEKAYEKREEIEDKFKKQGRLRQYMDEVKTFFSLIDDYLSGEYREVPWFTIAAIVFALLYVLNPFDVIPDFIPVIGYIDDAAVVAACLHLVREDLRDYEAWRARQKA